MPPSLSLDRVCSSERSPLSIEVVVHLDIVTEPMTNTLTVESMTAHVVDRAWFRISVDAQILFEESSGVVGLVDLNSSRLLLPGFARSSVLDDFILGDLDLGRLLFGRSRLLGCSRLGLRGRLLRTCAAALWLLWLVA